MVNVIFVHGTGVREPAFGELLQKVRTRLTAALRPHPVQLHGCYWGEECGSRLENPVSIPAYTQAKAMNSDADAAAADDELTAWALLYDDPLIELRLYAAQSEKAGGLALGRPPHAQLVTTLDSLKGKLPALGAAAGADPELLQASVEAVAGYSSLKAAIDHCTRINSGDLNPAREVIARAIVAGWTARLIRSGQATPDAAGRDKLVMDLFGALDGDEKQQKKIGAILRWTLLAPLRMLAKPPAFVGLQAATVTSRLLRNSLFDLVSPAVGDILLYQARGQSIRDHIAAFVEGVGEPVVLIAHSLGGIACIEWLLQQHRPQVKGVITAGSQAPYFHEIGALATLRRGDPLPAHMPPWLNFYDRNDLLSFIAYPALKHAGQDTADERICDEEVRSWQPFPASHGAYWSSDLVWQKTAAFIGRCLP